MQSHIVRILCKKKHYTAMLFLFVGGRHVVVLSSVLFLTLLLIYADCDDFSTF